MSENTVKPGLTPNRTARVVENQAYAAFVQRILRAYAARVGAGDVEALRGLVQLRIDVDTVVRTAVTGLRAFGYSWSEIASRLGVTRQAAQMRYGDPTDRGALDRRLLAAGLAVSAATLVDLFAEHHPGAEPASACPSCAYPYPDEVTDCPTLAVVRALLYRRRSENPTALARLTTDQRTDLYRTPIHAYPTGSRPAEGQTRLDLAAERAP